MTRRLGVNGRRKGLAVLTTVSLATLLACGVTTSVGCGGGDNTGSPTPDSGQDVNTSETGPTPEAGKDSAPDTGPGQPEAGTDAPPDVPLPKVATPSCSPAPGTFTSAQSVTVADTTSGATIFYTTDGTNPNPNSQVFTTPLSVSKTTQIRAYATASGYQDSDVVSCAYTINIPPNQVDPPTASPSGNTYNNDFPAALTTTTAGATICFTLDGSTPVCQKGQCVAPSQTYNAQTRIPINGTVTDPTTGTVTLSAIACADGMTDGVMTPVKYTLQVAQPTLQGPAPGTTTYGGVSSTVNPTVASITTGATGLYTVSTGILTTDPNGTSCTNGKTLNALPSNALSLAQSKGNQTAFVVGCKAGYLASATAVGAYTIQLNTPGVGTGLGPATYAGLVPVTVSDPSNGGTATTESVCVTTDGTTAPACGTNGGGCATGQQALNDGSAIVFATNKRATKSLNVDQTVVQEIACASNFAQSANYGSGKPYGLKLDPIKLTCTPSAGTGGTCTNGNVLLPNAGNVKVVVTEDLIGTAGHTADEAYDYVCTSTDGTVPDCACNNPGHLTNTPVASLPLTITATAVEKVQAIGCISATSTPNGAQGDVFQPTAVATVSISTTGSMAPPVINQCDQQANTTAAPTNCSTSPTMFKPQQVEFQNNNATGGASAYFCYTINNTTPADISAPPSCFSPGTTPGTGNNPAGSNTFCTSYVTAPGAISRDGPYGPSNASQPGPIDTGRWIQAIACDATAGQPNTPSQPASTEQFTLVVAPPVLVGTGAVYYGQAVTFTTQTPGAQIFYSTDNKTTPTCSTANFNFVTASTTPDPTDKLYHATYYAMGQETGGVLKTIGCESGYSSSTTTPSFTFTYSVAQPVAFWQDPATSQFVQLANNTDFDDYPFIYAHAPGLNNTWFCGGTNPACGTTANQCINGGIAYPNPGTTTCTANPMTPSLPTGCGASPNPPCLSAGQPGGPLPPQCNATSGFLPNSSLGSVPKFVACVVPPGASAVSTSASTTFSFTYHNSTLQGPPATESQVSDLSFSGTPSGAYPLGDGTAAHSKGATGGNGGSQPGSDYICASATKGIASIGGQPSVCGSFANCSAAGDPTKCAPVVPGWTCIQSNSGGFDDPGATLKLLQQGVSGTYTAFSCKDGMTWNTATFPVAFTPYAHSTTFAMTGATSDFSTGEQISGSDSAAAYVTWDKALTTLYVGYQHTFGAGDLVHFYIGSPTGGTYAPDLTLLPTQTEYLPNNSFSPAAQRPPVNFNGLYHVYWNVNGTASGMDKSSGTSWTAVTTPNIQIKYNGTDFVEFAIPFASIPATVSGSNYSFALAGADWTGTAEVGAWPAQTDPTTTSPVQNWTAFQSENTGYAYTPNATQTSCSPACTSGVGVTCCLQ